MSSKELIRAGSSKVWSRVISRKDILDFAELSQDKGIHHIEEGKKLLAHGLLVASIPTKIGGDFNFIARDMEFKFIKPVFEGEMVTCKGEIVDLVERESRYKVKFSFVCINRQNEVVMKGSSKGIIWK